MAETSVIQSEVDRVFRRMGVTGQAAAILMIVFGVLVIAFTELVAYLIGLYLIIVGIVQLLGNMEAGRARTSGPPTGQSPGS